MTPKIVPAGTRLARLAAAAALAALAVEGAAAQPAPLPLSQIPGVAVTYYDVAGNTTKKIRASIDAQRPKGPDGKVQPSSSRWSIATDIQKEKVGMACKVTRVTATLKAEVVLPRLVNPPDEKVPAEVLKQWRKYAASLEEKQAALLRQVHARVLQVERAVMGSSCERAGQAASAAIAEISRQVAAAPTP